MPESTLRKRSKAAEANVETAMSDVLRAGQFDFLNRMSHEVWTPMNGILGMTRLTMNTNLDADQRKYLKALETSAERLREVLTTAMDFSRLGDGASGLYPWCRSKGKPRCYCH